MTTTVLLIGALIVAANPDPTAEDLAAYQQADATVGRTPDAHVRLALWCEAHGLNAERLKHLARAVLADPTHATARGLLGLVAYQGQWKRPEAVARKVQADDALTAKLAEYNARRGRARDTADAQWALALWCAQNGLDAEAQAHFTAVTRLDPAREAAWKRLGYKKAGGRWTTDARLAAEKAEAEAQKKADRHWKPLLTKYRSMLTDKNKRDTAEAALAAVSDPRAVPSVWSVFVAGSSNHEHAVQILGQIDVAASSRALAMLAVFDGSAEVRRAATETLKRRDPREFAGMLIALMRRPIRYQVRQVGGPGSPGVLFVEGERLDVQRLYAPGAQAVATRLGDGIGVDAFGMPVLLRYAGSNQSINLMGGSNPFSDSTGRLTGQQILHLTDQQLLSKLGTDDVAVGIRSGSLPPLMSALRDPRNGEAGVVLANFLQAQISAHLQEADGFRQSMAAVVHDVARREHKSLSSFGFALGNARTYEQQIPVGQMMLEAQKSAIVAQQQLESDVAAIDACNRDIESLNASVVQILSAVAGKDVGQDQQSWMKWFVDQLGYAYKSRPDPPKPTVVETVPILYQPQPVAAPNVSIGSLPMYQRMSCFGAGTLVRTLDGSRPIETIRVGDRVLTLDVRTGALGYHPVTVVHHNPPSPTFLVKLGKDTIVSSPFHRFWIAGAGWKMARDLKGGETLRLLDGPARVESVEEGPVQLVYNLDVAGDHDFFAGAAAALVHDNTLPDTRLVAFDAAPAVIAAAETRGR